jgi:hypothetical protein
MQKITLQQFIFHPATVLIVSVTAALIFAGLICLLFEGDLCLFLLYYFVPIGIPFIAFLFDRLEQYKNILLFQWLIDLPVLILSLTRAVVLIPIISGHALFLTYSLLTSQSPIARITALMIALQVIYLKLFIWHDMTLFGGAIIGGLAA